MRQPSKDSSFNLHCLIGGISKKEPVIMQILYDSYAPSLYIKIISILEDPARTSKILEKTFQYAISHIEQHDGHSRLHCWLLEIAHYKILEEAANKCVGKALPEEGGMRRYSQAWAQLDEEQKTILSLKFFKGYNPFNLARELNMSPEQVEERISEALTRFHFLFS